MATSLSDFMGLTTELQAVNVGLEAIGQSPINSLNIEDTTADSANALRHLGEANRDVQEEGWPWNSEESYPLDPDAHGNIFLPSNTLKFKQAYFDGGWNVELVQRGNQLYDRRNHTFLIKNSATDAPMGVKVDIVFLLEYTQLPQAARTYIALEGARRLVAAKLVSTTASRLTESMVGPARVRLEQSRHDADQSTMADNPHVKAVRSRRRGIR